MSVIDIEIISPSGPIYQGSAYCINIPTIDGEMVFAPNCESVVTLITKGNIKIFDQSLQIIENITIQGGTAKITDNKIDILVDI